MSEVQEAFYYDLHVKGAGDLFRVREVKPKPGQRRFEPFLACTIKAANGPADDVSYKYYDCTVPAEDAAHLVRKCMDALSEGKRVFVGFLIGDPYLIPFIYKSGAYKGQPGGNLKGRLLYLSWIKINGECVYRDQSREVIPLDEPPAEPKSSSAPAPSSKDSTKVQQFTTSQAAA